MVDTVKMTGQLKAAIEAAQSLHNETNPAYKVELARHLTKAEAMADEALMAQARSLAADVDEHGLKAFIRAGQADDHPYVRIALAALTAPRPDHERLVEAARGALKCLELSVQSFPDDERQLREALAAFGSPKP